MEFSALLHWPSLTLLPQRAQNVSQERLWDCEAHQRLARFNRDLSMVALFNQAGTDQHAHGSVFQVVVLRWRENTTKDSFPRNK
eukprot:5384223-Amphidinium_carterae.1